jgi:hypothetical protein
LYEYCLGFAFSAGGHAMIPKYKTLVGILSLAVLQCSSEAPPEPSVTPSSCPARPYPGNTIVGCGLAPSVALLGVDEQAFYTVDGSRTFFAVSRQTGQPMRLYHSQTSSPFSDAASQLVSASFQGGTIYLLDRIDKGSHAYDGIVSLDARTPGSPSPVLTSEPRLTGFVVSAEGSVYYAEIQSGVPDTLVRAPLGGGPPQVIYSGPGAGPYEPFAVHGGYLYFMTTDRAIRRVPVAGGADNLILSKLPTTAGSSGNPIGAYDLAVDDNYLYVPVPSLDGRAPHTIKSYAVTGGDSGAVIASYPTGYQAEVPAAPPSMVRVDGNYVYFQAGMSPGLARVKLGGDGQLETPGSATKAPPVFDATSIYVTEQLGGDDSPLQGVIVRLPK